MATLGPPTTMLAWQKHLPSKTPVRVEVPVPTAQEDEILVKIHATGGVADIPFLDYAIKEMETMPPEFAAVATKWTMGHEGCGEVVSRGRAVTKFKLGDMVAIMCVPGCGGSTCSECSSNVPQLCASGPRYGGGKDGFFAPYATVHERAAVKLPAGVSAAVGAVATDACMTAYHAVVGTGEVKKSDTVLLLGLGGLGFNALQIILDIGAQVVVSDQRQFVLDEAVKFGVLKGNIVPTDTVSVSGWIHTQGTRIDTVIDFVAMPETFKAGIDSVRPGGKYVLVGLLSPDLSFRTATVVRKEIKILGSYAGTCADIEACLDLIALGRLAPQVVTGRMENFPSVLEELHSGGIKSRIALIPEGIEIGGARD